MTPDDRAQGDHDADVAQGAPEAVVDDADRLARRDTADECHCEGGDQQGEERMYAQFRRGEHQRGDDHNQSDNQHVASFCLFMSIDPESRRP